MEKLSTLVGRRFNAEAPRKNDEFRMMNDEPRVVESGKLKSKVEAIGLAFRLSALAFRLHHFSFIRCSFSESLRLCVESSIILSRLANDVRELHFLPLQATLRRQHPLQLGAILRFQGNERQAVNLLDKPHHGQCRLHRNGAGLDEVGLHQRQQVRVQPSRLGEPPSRHKRVSRVIGPGISLDATEITPTPPAAIRGSVKASSPETTRKSAGTAFSTSIC